jgi:hypothetical protein
MFPFKIVAHQDSTRLGFWAGVDRHFFGGPDTVPADTVGLTTDELAGLMSAWRRRALSQNHRPKYDHHLGPGN